MKKLNLNLDSIEKMSERELSQVYGGADTPATTGSFTLIVTWSVAEGSEIAITRES